MHFCSSSKAVYREKWKKAKKDNRKCLCLKTGKKGWKYQNGFYVASHFMVFISELKMFLRERIRMFVLLSDTMC